MKILTPGITSAGVSAAIAATYPTTVPNGGTGGTTAATAADGIKALGFSASQTQTVTEARQLRVNAGTCRRSAAGVAGTGYTYGLISGTVNFTGGSTPGWFLLGSNASVTGKGRAIAALGGNANHLPGTFDAVNWNKGWRLRFRAMIQIATHASSIVTLQIGGTTTPTDHPMTAKGVRLTFRGTGAACEAVFGTYASSEVVGTGGAWTANDTTEYDFEVEYVPGQGLYCWKDNDTTPLCSYTTAANLPSGTGTTGNTNLGWVFEGNSAAANRTLLIFNDHQIERTTA